MSPNQQQSTDNRPVLEMPEGQEPPHSDQWQQLSRWSVLSFTLSASKQLLMQGYAVVPIVYTGWKKGFDSPLMLLVISAVLLGIIINGLVQYFTFRFRALDNKLEVRRGLVFVRRDELPLDKIQNIRLDQPFYFKPLNLCTLVIETAGSSDSEVSIAAMSLERAQELKSHLLGEGRHAADAMQGATSVATSASTSASTSAAASDATSAQGLAEASAKASGASTKAQGASAKTSERRDDIQVIHRSARELVIFGLYHNNLIWLAVFAGSLLGQIPLHEIIERLGFEAASQWQSKGPLLLAMLSLALIAAGYLALSLLSVLFALLKYFPYALHLLHSTAQHRPQSEGSAKRQPTLERRGGIIAHQQDAAAMRRVQLVAFNQPPLARLIGRWTVFFHQVKGSEVERVAKLPMLVPALKESELAPLLAKLAALPGGDASLPSISTLNPIHKAWFYRKLIPLLVVAVAALIALSSLVSTSSLLSTSSLIGELVLTGALLASLGLWLRYRHYGYQHSNDLLWLRSGLLGHTLVRIPLGKVQHVRLHQSPWQRRHKLATLELGLASGVQRLPWVPLEHAKAIADHSLRLTRTDRRNWI
ncbi:PH domain-containing protein [Shewanella sp. JM162201]|uniref:PH domain-containing protein n=1 Tax=Shewanella jiangmenensis TaxID=2837387 RepID=A0ABS5V244_9GAMM|nr:PH domain-containing protein [Shewanella jiangmenensis]MBT1443719.1 PH domain-containing protein [Shewanella jiangmenensis]